MPLWLLWLLENPPRSFFSDWYEFNSELFVRYGKIVDIGIPPPDPWETFYFEITF